MNKKSLINQIKNKRSFLCIGLDSDINKIPSHLLRYEDPIFEFNKQIIDATKDLCVAYKPNIAFYESMGVKGWTSLEKTLDYIPDDLFTIADAKRGDIGNTSHMYAKSFFENMSFDAITVAPYMGSDSIAPFFKYKDKWVIILALTSNKGSVDFQMLPDEQGHFLYENVLKQAKDWSDDGSLMFVVGATKSKDLETVRSIVPNHFLLVPGVGAQGGSLEDVVKAGFNKDCGLLINSSRGILYSSNSKDFAKKSRDEAKMLQSQMSDLMERYNF